MKKNKKYWKKQAKNWRSYGLEMQDLFFAEVDRVHQLEHEVGMFKGLANERLRQYEKQSIAFKAVKHDLSILRQYNIGQKAKATTGTSGNINWVNWAIKQYNIPVGMNPILKELNDLVLDDQSSRTKYAKLIDDHNGDWRVAKKKWIESGKGVKDDVFADISSGRQERAKMLIRDNIDLIKSRSSAIQNAWLLVQHMDNDVEFQSWFLNYLEPESQEYKFLTDRVAINKGRRQKYNTQNVDKLRRWFKRNK